MNIKGKQVEILSGKDKGKKGEVIKEISIAARKEISNFLGKKVHLFLRVRPKKSA